MTAKIRFPYRTILGMAVGLTVAFPHLVHAADCPVPLPGDVLIVAPDPGMPQDLAAFVGQWKNGRWNGSLCGALIVERVEADGTAHTIYAWGKGQSFDAGYTRVKGDIDDGELQIYPFAGTEVTYTLTAPNILAGTYYRNGQWSISLTRR